MKSISDILKEKTIKGDYRNKNEHQAYGNRLADDLGDQRHRALYIKLAKEEDRKLLEQARDFVMGSATATTKGRLFMWKLKQLRDLRKSRETHVPEESEEEPKEADTSAQPQASKINPILNSTPKTPKAKLPPPTC